MVGVFVVAYMGCGCGNHMVEAGNHMVKAGISTEGMERSMAGDHIHSYTVAHTSSIRAQSQQPVLQLQRVRK